MSVDEAKNACWQLARVIAAWTGVAKVEVT
jgi:hypothetical protein